jgi:hypothetical protein
MPRPYNWIRGEGTTKAQRWGLAGLGAGAERMELVPFGYGGMGSLIPGAMGPTAPPEFDNTFPDVEQQIADLWDSVLNPPVSFGQGSQGANIGTTLGSWLQNNMLLVGLGVGAFLLLRRR